MTTYWTHRACFSPQKSMVISGSQKLKTQNSKQVCLFFFVLKLCSGSVSCPLYSAALEVSCICLGWFYWLECAPVVWFSFIVSVSSMFSCISIMMTTDWTNKACLSPQTPMALSGSRKFKTRNPKALNFVYFIICCWHLTAVQSVVFFIQLHWKFHQFVWDGFTVLNVPSVIVFFHCKRLCDGFMYINNDDNILNKKTNMLQSSKVNGSFRVAKVQNSKSNDFDCVLLKLCSSSVSCPLYSASLKA